MQINQSSWLTRLVSSDVDETGRKKAAKCRNPYEKYEQQSVMTMTQENMISLLYSELGDQLGKRADLSWKIRITKAVTQRLKTQKF